MSVKDMKIRDKLLLIILTMSWVMLFANIGKAFITPIWAGELVGVFCGISISFLTIYVYKKLLLDK